MKRIILIVVPVLIAVAAIAGFFIYRYNMSKTIFNDSYVNGNIPGNLYNKGFFCEHDGTVYFSNANDNNYLYSMTSDGGEVTKLYSDIASFINADDNYVYYVRSNLAVDTDYAFLRFNTNSLCRYSLRTKKVLILDPDPCIYASLVGNYVYYIHYNETEGSALYRVKIDGTEKEMVDKIPYFTCSASGQFLYFNGLESDHNIYQMDTASNIKNVLYQGNCWMPIVESDRIYFMDCNDNYSLCSLGITDSQPTVLSDKRLEFFNVFGNYIYFQYNDTKGDAAFCRINTDGSDFRVIREGNYCNINITSGYVYFQEYNSDVMYRIPTGGDGLVEIFNP